VKAPTPGGAGAGGNAEAACRENTETAQNFKQNVCQRRITGVPLAVLRLVKMTDRDRAMRRHGNFHLSMPHNGPDACTRTHLINRSTGRVLGSDR
jgi:hypothetical protein